jgi:membrane fusion protein
MAASGLHVRGLSLTALFRQEVLRHQSQAAIGETMRIVPISHAAFTLFLVGIIAVALTYAAFAGYSRKETVTGFISPSGGVVRLVAPRVGTITDILVKEGEVVTEDQILFRVVAEETNASGVGSDTAILDALKQQKSVLEEQIHNENEHAKSEGVRLESLVRGLKSEVAELESQRGIQAERAQSARVLSGDRAVQGQRLYSRRHGAEPVAVRAVGRAESRFD